MMGNRPLAFWCCLVGVACLFWFVCLLGFACVLFPIIIVFPFLSMMTWALRPHGVRTRGKKWQYYLYGRPVGSALHLAYRGSNIPE